MQQQRRRHWWRWGVGGAAVAAIAMLAGFWLMFQHIPTWYRPIEVAADDYDRVRNDLPNVLGAINNSLNQPDMQPFELRLTQDRINTWISAREAIDPTSRNWLPDGVRSPMVVIDATGIRLAAIYQQGNLRSVISAQLALSADHDAIRAKLMNVSGGSLHLPASVIREYLASLDHTIWPAGKRMKTQLGSRPLPKLASLWEGIDLPNTWQLDIRSFRIIALRCEPQALIITFEPLPSQSRRT